MKKTSLSKGVNTIVDGTVAEAQKTHTRYDGKLLHQHADVLQDRDGNIYESSGRWCMDLDKTWH